MIATILGNLRNTVIAGFVLAFLIFLLYLTQAEFNNFVFWPFLVRWFHIGSGIMWIGLLWYFNFVQTPTMPKIPDELKPALGRFITPAALFWFRWAAMGTILLGIALAYRNGYLAQAYTLGAYEPGGESFSSGRDIAIGIGMWLGTIMWFNVWFVIWPNQQKALNIGGKYPDLAAPAKAAAGKTAMIFSRVNTMLSIPMLFCMVGAMHI